MWFGTHAELLALTGVVPPPAPKPAPHPTYTLHRVLALTHPQLHGSDVGAVQRLVGAPVDHPTPIYGPVTKAHVVAWQRAHHIKVDGIFGPQSAHAAGWAFAPAAA